MSTFLYGRLTRRRIETPGNDLLVIGPANDTDKPTVTPWQDALAALVPAEVLALHGVIMSFGTSTTGSGQDAVTKITYPSQMVWAYCGLLVLVVILYFVGAKSVRTLAGWLRAAVAAAAFVAWTMIQPSTAFDAFGLDLTTFARVVIALFAAVLLGLAARGLALLAAKA